MYTVHVNNSRAYDVHIGRGLLTRAGELMLPVIKSCRAAVISDSTVGELYGGIVEDSLRAAGYETLRYAFPAGEQNKHLGTLGGILEFLAQNQMTRTDVIVALGGGVTGDMAGFAAATYQRGMKFVQLATTLLAQIDSSVGGKTAVDLPQGKNLVGAFWQPSLVLCDTNCLATLPTEVLADGLSEAVKYGMIADKALLDQLCTPWMETHAEDVIARCIEIKAAAVEADERDNGERQKLNFGHTAGHAIERHSNFTLTHGHAVAMGMAVVTRACVKRGLVSQETLDALEKALDYNGLPDQCPCSAAILAEGAGADKKRRGSGITLVLPETAGKCILAPFQLSELEAFFQDGL